MEGRRDIIPPPLLSVLISASLLKNKGFLKGGG